VSGPPPYQLGATPVMLGGAELEELEEW
jgi:hypothetical protein